MFCTHTISSLTCVCSRGGRRGQWAAGKTTRQAALGRAAAQRQRPYLQVAQLGHVKQPQDLGRLLDGSVAHLKAQRDLGQLQVLRLWESER